MPAGLCHTLDMLCTPGHLVLSFFRHHPASSRCLWGLFSEVNHLPAMHSPTLWSTTSRHHPSVNTRHPGLPKLHGAFLLLSVEDVACTAQPGCTPTVSGNMQSIQHCHGHGDESLGPPSSWAGCTTKHSFFLPQLKLIVLSGFSLLWFMDPNAFLPCHLHAGLLYFLLVSLGLT